MKSKVTRIVQRTTSLMLVVYNSRPLLARYVWKLPGNLALLAVLSPSATTLN